MTVCKHCKALPEAIRAPRAARQQLWGLSPVGAAAPVPDRSVNFYLKQIKLHSKVDTVGRDGETEEGDSVSSDGKATYTPTGAGGAVGGYDGQDVSSCRGSQDRSFLEEGDLDRLYNSAGNLAPFEPQGGVQTGDLFLPLASNILPGSELAQVAKQAQEFRFMGPASGFVAPNRPTGSRATTSATLTHGGGPLFPSGGIDAEAGITPVPTQIQSVPSGQFQAPSWPTMTTPLVTAGGGVLPPPPAAGGGYSLPPAGTQTPHGGGYPQPTPFDPQAMQAQIQRWVAEAMRQQPAASLQPQGAFQPRPQEVSMDTSFGTNGPQVNPLPLTDEAVSRTEQYRQYLNTVLVQHLATPELMVQRNVPRDSLDRLSGDTAVRAPWGLTLPADRVSQLQASFESPVVAKSMTNSSSPFRMLPTVFASAFRAPTLDPYLADHGSSARTKPRTVDPGQVSSWRRQLGPLYEASMASYRIGVHQSIITNALAKLVDDHGLDVLAPTVSFLAQAERELMATSAQAASHSVALMRKMALAPLCYAQKVKTSISAIPFQGDLLFGPSLSTALQTETDKAKQAKDEDALLYEKSSSSAQRAYTPKGAAQKPPAEQQGQRSRGPKRSYKGPKGPQPVKAPKHSKPSASNRGPKVKRGPKDRV